MENEEQVEQIKKYEAHKKSVKTSILKLLDGFTVNDAISFLDETKKEVMKTPLNLKKPIVY